MNASSCSIAATTKVWLDRVLTRIDIETTLKRRKMKDFEIAKMIQAYRHSQDESCMRICECVATDTHTHTLFYKLIICAHTQTHAVQVCLCMAKYNTILMPHKSAANPTAKTIYSEVRRKFPKLMKLVSPALMHTQIH